jgi:hypothetical protein
VAQLLAVDNFDGSVCRVRNEDAAAGLVDVTVVEATSSSVSWKRNLSDQVERH